jgi:predicted MFS family arabinose efflux permease
LSLKEKIGAGKRHIDGLGAATITGSVVSILLALMIGGEHQGAERAYGWTSAPVIGLFSAGILLLGLFLWIETKAREPIVPLQLFRIRALAASGLSGFFVSAAIFGAIAYIPLYVQGVAGASPAAAGYSLVPLMLASAVTSTVSGRLMSRLSYRAIVVPSLALTGIGFFLLCRMTAETSGVQLAANLVITGLGMGAIFPTLGTAAQSAVDWSMRGVATSSNQFFRSVGGTIGVSVLGTLLAERMKSGLLRLSDEQTLPADQLRHLADPQVLLDAQSRASLPQEALLELQHVFTDALSLVFRAGLAFVCLSLLAGLFLGSARLVKPSKG